MADDHTTPAERIGAFLTGRQTAHRGSRHIAGVTANGGYHELMMDDLSALLAERDALARQWDDDVRAVAEACAEFGNDNGPRAIRQLYAHFEGRILDATTAAAR